MSNEVSKTIEYEILAVAFEKDRLLAHRELQTIVQGHLRAGWEPLGAPFLNTDMIYQAVVKRPHLSVDPAAPVQELKTTYPEKKQFSERFSPADWMTLCRHAEFVQALGRSIPEAEIIARRLLPGHAANGQ